MALNFANSGLAFLEGLALVVSPCILPILPFVLGSAVDGRRGRPVGVVVGFIAAFTLFVLASRHAFGALNVDTEFVRKVSLGLLAILGFVMASGWLGQRMTKALQVFATLGTKLGERWSRKPGFLGGLGVGALIGLVWTPCAGPIFAAAIIQILQAQNGFESGLTIAAFAIGAGVPMLAIALFGREALSRFSFLHKHTETIRRSLGIVIVLAAVAMFVGADVKILAMTGGKDMPKEIQATLRDTLDTPYPAPDIAAGGVWLNSAPLRLSDLRGKVVLVDFWTYSCINCVRTLPYLTRWYETYKDKGLVIVGVHAPEFEFERKVENVEAATKRFGITYPVILDNALETWENFHNRYWPAHYLIDRDGKVVYTHFGEGQYDVTEGNIRALLDLGIKRPDGKDPEAPSPSSLGQTSETYLGHDRANAYANTTDAVLDAPGSYAFPAFLPIHAWALNGDWKIGREDITTQSPGAGLRLSFSARTVFLVLGTSASMPIHVHVMLNGQTVSAKNNAGTDAQSGTVTVDHDRLYALIDQGEAKKGLLEITADAPGLHAYAFTFGG